MRLVGSLSNLPIGKSVQENVQAAVDALQKVIELKCHVIVADAGDFRWRDLLSKTHDEVYSKLPELSILPQRLSSIPTCWACYTSHPSTHTRSIYPSLHPL
jgi:hypothetical protein